MSDNNMPAPRETVKAEGPRTPDGWVSIRASLYKELLDVNGGKPSGNVSRVAPAADSASLSNAPIKLTEQQRREFISCARTLNDPTLDVEHRELELIAYVEALAAQAVRPAPEEALRELEALTAIETALVVAHMPATANALGEIHARLRAALRLGSQPAGKTE